MRPWHRGLTVLSCDDSTSQCLLPYKATITRIEISRTVFWDFHRLSGRFRSDSCVLASHQSHRFRPDSTEPEPVLSLDSQAGCNSMIFPQVGIFSLFDTSPIFSPEHDFFALRQNKGRLLCWWQWLINYIAISIHCHQHTLPSAYKKYRRYYSYTSIAIRATKTIAWFLNQN